jgi:hypothetical protein
MLKEPIEEKKSTLVQIMNEVDDLKEEEKSFVLYWIRTKKNALAAVQADSTIIPNDLVPRDIYEERDSLRKQRIS